MRWRDDQESSDEESDSTVDSEDEISLNKAKQKKKETQNTKQRDFEVVPIEDNSKYIFLSKCATMFYLKGNGIPIPGNLCLWNPELGKIFLWDPKSWTLESRIQLKESGIRLTIGKV